MKDLSIFENCPSLNNLNIPALELISGSPSYSAIYMYNTGFTSLSFPKLRRIIGYTSFSNNGGLTSLSFPMLLQMNSITGQYNPSLISVSCPLLQTILSFSFISNSSLATLSFPALTEFKGTTEEATQMWDCPNISTITLGNLTSFKNREFSIQGGKMSSAIVNGLLHSFITITPALINTRISLGGQQPPAPPTGQGITDKATLVANNNYVYTD